MLALTRKVGEEIIIGDPAKPLGIIRVVDIQGDKVRLSFDFPRNIDINRSELAIKKARQAESGGTNPNSSPATPPIIPQPDDPPTPGPTAAAA